MEEMIKKVRAAATATWWTLLFAIAFGLFQTLSYAAMVAAKPEWMLRWWGPGVTWETLQPYALSIFTAYKLVVWIVLVVAVWLSLWLMKLKKALPANPPTA